MNMQHSAANEKKRARERDRENRKIIFSCTDRILVCTLARSLLVLTEHANHTNSGTRSRLERIFTYVLGFHRRYLQKLRGSSLLICGGV